VPVSWGGFAAHGLEPSLVAGSSSKTSVIVSRKEQQQQQQQSKTTPREPPRSYEHTFLMTPRIEDNAERSDEDWNGCY
jgi:hypothetical protein